MMIATLLGRYNKSMNTATSGYLKLSSVFCIDSFSSRNSCSEMYVVTFITSSPRRKIIASRWTATKAYTSDVWPLFLTVWKAHLGKFLLFLLAVLTCNVRTRVSVCIYASWSLIWQSVQEYPASDKRASARNSPALPTAARFFWSWFNSPSDQPSVNFTRLNYPVLETVPASIHDTRNSLDSLIADTVVGNGEQAVLLKEPQRSFKRILFSQL